MKNKFKYAHNLPIIKRLSSKTFHKNIILNSQSFYLVSKHMSFSSKSNNINKSSTSILDSTEQEVLSSKLIQTKLYSEQDYGYYSSKNPLPLAKLSSRLNFKSITSINKYYSELEKLYPQGSYTTASEILHPFYGFCVGNYILKKMNEKEPLFHKDHNFHLIEVGCGQGGLADSLYLFFKKFDISKYNKLKYTAYESNKLFAESTKKLLQESNKKLIAKNPDSIKVINKSVFDSQKQNKPKISNKNEDSSNKESRFILLFNFLNSLPHDRFKINRKKISSVISHLLTSSIDKISDRALGSMSKETLFLLREQFKDSFLQYFKVNKGIIAVSHFNLLTSSEYFVDVCDIINSTEYSTKEYLIDNLVDYFFPGEYIFSEIMKLEVYKMKEDWILKIIRALQRRFGREFLWLPSSNKSVFSLLEEIYPNSQYIINDFDFLVSEYRSDLRGVNAPSIYYIKKDSNESVNIRSLKELMEYNPVNNSKNRKDSNKENSLGEFANIYFPVDFEFLRKQYFFSCGRELTLIKQPKFMFDNFLFEWYSTSSTISFNPLVKTHLNSSFLLSVAN